MNPEPKAASSTRERLLRAAEQIIVEKGLAAVTSRSVTRAADANVSLISYHFGSVEELLLELFNLNFAKFEGPQDFEVLARAGGDLHGILEALVRAWWQPAVFTPHGRCVAVIEAVYGSRSEALRSAAAERLKAGLLRVVEVVAPLTPHLDRRELLFRLTSIGGAIRTMAPRASTWEVYCALVPAADLSERRIIARATAFAAAALASP